ncbi:MAG: ABC transporter permease [Deltaproteobacteria bacterium]|nr:ABC transporter permease [Deltaproteobacteria bacterium]
MGLFLTVAVRNLLQAKRRTALLVTALAGVTLLLVLLMALSAGLTETMIRSATAISSGHVNVAGFSKNKPADAWPVLHGIEAIRRKVADLVPEATSLVVRERAWAKLISDRHSLFVSPTGVDYASEARLKEALVLAKESDYKKGGRDVVVGDLSKLAEPHTAVLFAGQAKRLDVEVGDDLTITAPTGAGRTNTLDVRIVAIARDFGFLSNWVTFLPRQDVKDLYQYGDDTGAVVQVYLPDPAGSEEVMGRLREGLAAAGHELMDHEPAPFFMKFERVAGEDWTGQKLDVTVWSDEVSFLKWVVTALDAISVVLVGILMVIIALGITDSMWIAVRERTREVGTERAIGMTRRQVLALFLVEAMLLGLAGTTLGGLAGAGVAALLDHARIEVAWDALRMILMSDVLNLAVGPGQVAWSIGVFTLLTGVAALPPAVRAARMQPVTAMHHAG